MSIVYLLLPMALMLGSGFVAAFIWATNRGQYDDLETPAHRMLLEDSEKKILADTNERNTQ